MLRRVFGSLSAGGGRTPIDPERQAELAAVYFFIVLPLNLFVAMPLVAVFPPAELAIVKFLESRIGEEGEQFGRLMTTGYCRRYQLWYNCACARADVESRQTRMVPS